VAPTWTDRLDLTEHRRFPGNELAGVVTALGYARGCCRCDSGCSALTTGIAIGTLAEYVPSSRASRRLPTDVRTSRWARPALSRA